MRNKLDTYSMRGEIFNLISEFSLHIGNHLLIQSLAEFGAFLLRLLVSFHARLPTC